MLRSRFIASLLLTTLLGCGSGDAVEPTPGPLDGDWSGVSGGVTFAVRFDQIDDKMRGNGTLSGPGGSIPVSVRGSFVDPNLLLTISGSGSPDIDYTATLTNPTTIDGKFNGSGFNDFPMTLHKD
ncbi:MAG: hypothetical protein OEV95_03380 [Gemmatimonadota bacterium]|nr:hypothetical protein [Gemmatimonadota bacterium]